MIILFSRNLLIYNFLGKFAVDMIFSVNLLIFSINFTTISIFSLLSRLALPVCLNYLYIIDVVRLNQEDIVDTPQTAFAKVHVNTKKNYQRQYGLFLNCIIPYTVFILIEYKLRKIIMEILPGENFCQLCQISCIYTISYILLINLLPLFT